jgi:hypothetical protein
MTVRLKANGDYRREELFGRNFSLPAMQDAIAAPYDIDG